MCLTFRFTLAKKTGIWSTFQHEWWPNIFCFRLLETSSITCIWTTVTVILTISGAQEEMCFHVEQSAPTKQDPLCVFDFQYSHSSASLGLGHLFIKFQHHSLLSSSLAGLSSGIISTSYTMGYCSLPTLSIVISFCRASLNKAGPNHPSNGPSEAQDELWGKPKMAVKFGIW